MPPPPPGLGPWAGAHADFHLMSYVHATQTATPMYSINCLYCFLHFPGPLLRILFREILLMVLLLILPVAVKCCPVC